MEKFLSLKIGMTIEQSEELLNEKFTIEHRREEHFKSDIVHFENVGVLLFFNPETEILETIRYEAPFALAVEDVKIGDTKKDVKSKKGIAPRIDPFPYPDTQPTTIWIYGSHHNADFVRFDFEKTRNGKCVRIIK